MVSQSSGQRDSPVDPLEGVSNDSGDVDGPPSLLDISHLPCQSDVKFTRHRAAWINPQGVQGQDLPLQVPTVGSGGSLVVRGAASPLGASPCSLESSSVETSLQKNTVGSAGSWGEQSSDSAFISTRELAVLPGRRPRWSLFPSCTALAASPHTEAGSPCLQPPHLTAPTSAGAVPVGRRSVSLNSFSPEAFTFPVGVEKENAHFQAADMIISAMETMKWDLLSGQHTENCSLDEASGSPGNDCGGSAVAFCTHRQQESGSSTSSDSGYEGCAVLQVSPVAQAPAEGDAAEEACTRDFEEFVIVELAECSDPSETRTRSCRPSKSVIYEPNFNSAELIARELYQVFRRCWVLSDAHHQLAVSLKVVNEERVQKDFESSVDFGEEIKFKSRIRGTEDWAPPRFQVIFNVHPPPKRDLVVAAQNFVCAGCGTPVEPKFVKRLRYCEYLGKYFCDCCHAYAESCIPARILATWDFRKYYVSNFAKQLLDSIWHQPLFNVLNVSRSLCAKARKLEAVMEIQEQLFHVKKLLKTCRFAERALKAFEQVPRHLTEELYLFSLEDLVKVKKGLLAPSLKDVLKAALDHVEDCELCQGKGFICEFCRSATVIFPFQTATCRRCSECRACFHKQCFQAARCPRCARIAARRRLSESLLSAAT
ncbi:protein associated with UVRAG as autophagy enhancer isoform X2 [Artibeus jamaicensis]|uniref:protein associated with UVRAG as autophagy enhancer isoform X2 n=1 Tax=Artibeus jamaicensis TaxID=9417 RepID=UPI00235AF7EE|nr:protein associated with UVRAG as autophagy enhancer isoform X2 [Artibeus jamaicensis]